jgi:hypothetical protein
LFLLFLCSISVRAQFQSAFVFAADPNSVAVYTRNDVSGVLTPVAGSPFPSKEAVSSMTLDFKGRYLFTANRTNSKISMFTIDPNTGALQEVPNPAFSAGVAPGSSTVASVTAGQTALYQMQLTPGAGYSGTMSLACSGAPLGALCQVPSTIRVANGVPAPFTVTVSTGGGAMLPPSIPRRLVPPAGIRVLFILALALVLLKVMKNRCTSDSALRARHLAWSGALTTIFLYSAIYAAGCGGGSTTVTPPPVITPSGTSTITVTPSALSLSGKPLQLQPIQLTLTVK